MRTEFEPFDSKLAQRIQVLSSQIENHTLQLANLRRTAPQNTAQRFEESYRKESERYDELLQKDEAAKLEQARSTTLDIGELERLDEIQSSWQSGTENLISLKSGLGGTVAKMERAQQAVEVLGSR